MNNKKVIIISSTIIGLFVILLITSAIFLKPKNNTLQVNNISEAEEKLSKISLKAKASGKKLKLTVFFYDINNVEYVIEKSYNKQFDDPKKIYSSYNSNEYEEDLTEDLENSVEKCFYRVKCQNNEEIIYSNVITIHLKKLLNDSNDLEDESIINQDDIIDIEDNEYDNNYEENKDNEHDNDYNENEPFFDEIIEESEKYDSDTVKSNNEVTYISLSESCVNLDLGSYDTINLVATITPSDAINKTIKWTSSDSQIASVDQNGKITAISNGTAIITARTSNGQSQTCEVNVTTLPEKVNLNKTSVLLDILNNREVYLQATIEPLTSIDKTLIWTSSNENVAIVDSEGNITANSNGTAVIKCETSNGKSATCTVSVTTSSSGIYLNKTLVDLNLYDTKQFNLIATIVPSNVSNKTITWASSDSNIATVDSNGMIVAKNHGNATITAKTSDGKIATCKVVVEDLVTNIKLDKTNISLNPKGNNKTKITATIYPSTATNKTLKWISSDSNIATVDSNGNVTARKPGKVLITAISCNNISASCTVNIMYTKGLYQKYDSSSKLHYWIYIPDISVIKDLSKIPLIIYLHGNGEAGNDLSLLKDNYTLVKLLSEDKSFNKYGAIIIAPQSSESWSSTSMVRLKTLVDNVVADYGINKDRISITGFSGGGSGCWDFAVKYPDFVSCVVQVAGYRSNYRGEGNMHKKLSYWGYVGERDTVAMEDMVSLYNKFKSYGGTANLTTVPGYGHGFMGYIPYKKYNILNWMASQTKK